MKLKTFLKKHEILKDDQYNNRYSDRSKKKSEGNFCIYKERKPKTYTEFVPQPNPFQIKHFPRK